MEDVTNTTNKSGRSRKRNNKRSSILKVRDQDDTTVLSKNGDSLGIDCDEDKRNRKKRVSFGKKYIKVYVKYSQQVNSAKNGINEDENFSSPPIFNQMNATDTFDQNSLLNTPDNDSKDISMLVKKNNCLLQGMGDGNVSVNADNQFYGSQDLIDNEVNLFNPSPARSLKQYNLRNNFNTTLIDANDSGMELTKVHNETSDLTETTEEGSTAVNLLSNLIKQSKMQESQSIDFDTSNQSVADDTLKSSQNFLTKFNACDKTITAKDFLSRFKETQFENTLSDVNKTNYSVMELTIVHDETNDSTENIISNKTAENLSSAAAQDIDNQATKDIGNKTSDLKVVTSSPARSLRKKSLLSNFNATLIEPNNSVMELTKVHDETNDSTENIISNKTAENLSSAAAQDIVNQATKDIGNKTSDMKVVTSSPARSLRKKSLPSNFNATLIEPNNSVMELTKMHDETNDSTENIISNKTAEKLSDAAAQDIVNQATKDIGNKTCDIKIFTPSPARSLRKKSLRSNFNATLIEPNNSVMELTKMHDETNDLIENNISNKTAENLSDAAAQDIVNQATKDIGNKTCDIKIFTPSPARSLRKNSLRSNFNATLIEPNNSVMELTKMHDETNDLIENIISNKTAENLSSAAAQDIDNQATKDIGNKTSDMKVVTSSPARSLRKNSLRSNFNATLIEPNNSVMELTKMHDETNDSIENNINISCVENMVEGDKLTSNIDSKAKEANTVSDPKAGVGVDKGVINLNDGSKISNDSCAKSYLNASFTKPLNKTCNVKSDRKTEKERRNRRKTYTVSTHKDSTVPLDSKQPVLAGNTTHTMSRSKQSSTACDATRIVKKNESITNNQVNGESLYQYSETIIAINKEDNWLDDDSEIPHFPNANSSTIYVALMDEEQDCMELANNINKEKHKQSSQINNGTFNVNKSHQEMLSGNTVNQSSHEDVKPILQNEPVQCEMTLISKSLPAVQNNSIPSPQSDISELNNSHIIDSKIEKVDSMKVESSIDSLDSIDVLKESFQIVEPQKNAASHNNSLERSVTMCHDSTKMNESGNDSINSLCRELPISLHPIDSNTQQQNYDLNYIMGNMKDIVQKWNWVASKILLIFSVYKLHRLIITIKDSFITDIAWEQDFPASKCCEGERNYLSVFKRLVNIQDLKKSYHEIHQLSDLVKSVAAVLTNWKYTVDRFYLTWENYLEFTLWTGNRFTVEYLFSGNVRSFFCLHIDYNTNDVKPLLTYSIEHNSFYSLLELVSNEVKLWSDETVSCDLLSLCDVIDKVRDIPVNKDELTRNPADKIIYLSAE